MNRIKDILKKIPTREDVQPMNIIYREDILFEDKIRETMPNKFDEMINNLLRKSMELHKKTSRRIKIQEDEEEKETFEEKPKKERKIPKKGEEMVEEEEEETAEGEPVFETEEEEKDFNEMSKIVEYIKRNKQGRIPNVENSYYLTNRKRFVEFIKRVFGDYKKELAAITKPASCDTLASDKKLSLLVHQRLITDYLNMYTPYRGLLLFHGLGSGKTCSSIAIAENFKNPNKQVIVMTPASLRPNFVKEIKKCGDFVYRLNNNWIWQTYEKVKKHASQLETEMYLSKGYIKKHRGVWVIDRETSGKSTTRKNRDAMNTRARHTLDEQLNEMIEKRYTLISYNGIRMSHLNKMTDEFTKNPFDNKVVIVDEAHKFISPIVNKLRKINPKKKAEPPKGVALNLYEYLLKAKNARIILLTGTPLVNYPNEIAVLYNILRGYIHTYEFTVRVKTSTKLTNETLTQMFNDSEISKQVDYFYYSPSESTLTITRNPFRFLNTKTTKGTYSGVKLDTEDTEGVDMIEDDFIKAVSAELKRLGLEVKKMEINNYKNLPDLIESFINRFYSGANLINKEQLSNRLVGLTSYFSGTPELLPRYNKEENYHVVNVPMSNYQADQYAIERSVELNQEEQTMKKKRKLKSGEEYDEPVSSYKIFSRLYCNYAFPIEIGRPKPGDAIDKAAAKEAKEEKETKKAAKKAEKKETKKAAKKGGAVEDEDEDDDTDTEYEFDEEEEEDEEEGDAEDMDEEEEENGSKRGGSEKPKRKVVVVSPDTAEKKPKGKKATSESKDSKESPKEKEQEEDEFKDVEEHDADEFLTEDKEYSTLIAEALQKLKENGETYLSHEGLEKYSPKFLRIIQNIQNPENEGLHLVYSQFRTMEGIGIFSLALDYNGFAEFKIAKDPATGLWQLNISEEDMAKPKYALYTGKETKEVKEIIMNIYNGFFDLVPKELVKVLREIAPNNNMGELIKVFMITASGAEGLDLKNTRYVHLMEPFWNFVRIEQVIGRAVRICSHKNLPEEYRNVEAFIYVSVFSEDQLLTYQNKASRKQEKGINKTLLMVMGKDASRIDKKTPITTDQNLYEISMRKEEAISQLLTTIKETSIDCTVYPSNEIEGLKCYSPPDALSLDYSYNPNLETDKLVALKKNV